MSRFCLILLAVSTVLALAQQLSAPEDPAELASMELQIKDARYLQAVPALRAYLVSHPSSWRAHYDLGYALSRARGGPASLNDNIKESIEELSKSLQLHRQNADAHKILGLDLTMIQRDDLRQLNSSRPFGSTPPPRKITTCWEGLTWAAPTMPEPSTNWG